MTLKPFIFLLVLSSCILDDEPVSIVESDTILFEKKLNTKNLHLVVLELVKNEFNSEILIVLKQNNTLLQSDSLTIEMSDPIIEMSDIDGDNVEDLIIEYLRPGRGGNNVSIVYLIKETPNKFIKINNAIYYPNLDFDKSLNYISSFGFYGGDAVEINFVEIKGDSISPKYRFIKEVQNCEIKILDQNVWITVDKLKLDPDIVIPEIISLEPKIKIKNAY
jgi:hypothetical protein